MNKPSKAASFLQNMKVGEEAQLPGPVEVHSPVKTVQVGKPSTRAGLKHIGGYFNAATVERVALLRARLDMDNSELIKRAIDDLYSKEKARRAFAD